MAVALKRKKTYTVAQYLAQEEKAVQKHEFYRGEIFAMAGGTVNHGRVVANIAAISIPGLRGKSCEMLPNDVRLQISAYDLFTYPDAMIICGEPEYWNDRDDTVANPVVIFEVLSPSTGNYDRGQKFQFYRSIPTLQEYVLVHPDQVRVEYHRKVGEEQWLLIELRAIDASLNLRSVNLTMPLRELYERVDWLTT